MSLHEVPAEVRERMEIHMLVIGGGFEGFDFDQERIYE